MCERPLEEDDQLDEMPTLEDGQEELDELAWLEAGE
jgi:hypothetical protein